ncbi:MAG: nitroreductase family protein [Candidatus Falkowbacteria bacterium]|nr:nitroreductase family protein [Candidatus Falkowbacteria bacterium]
MDFWEVIKKRKSIRSFDFGREITDEQLGQILQAGKRAPSAGGLYPIEFLVVREQETKEKLAVAANNQSFLINASVIIVVVANLDMNSRYGERGRSLYVIQDGAAATENMLLAITALGLAACWVGVFSESEASKVMELKENQRVLTILPIGWEK